MMSEVSQAALEATAPAVKPNPLIKPLQLNDREKQDLVSFMASLTGSNVDALVADAFAAPVGDVKKGDPGWVHGTRVELR